MKTFSYKQVILVREDLDMGTGKTASQSSHASVEAVLKSDKKIVEEWKKEGMKKVVLKVSNEEELLKYNKIAKDAGLKTALIKDAGLTEIKPNTLTCLAIGPDKEEKIDKITGKLKTL